MKGTETDLIPPAGRLSPETHGETLTPGNLGCYNFNHPRSLKIPKPQVTTSPKRAQNEPFSTTHTYRFQFSAGLVLTLIYVRPSERHWVQFRMFWGLCLFYTLSMFLWTETETGQLFWGPVFAPSPEFQTGPEILVNYLPPNHSLNHPQSSVQS